MATSKSLRASSGCLVVAVWTASTVAQPGSQCLPPPPVMSAWYTGDDCTPRDLLGNHDGVYSGNPVCPGAGKVGGGGLPFGPGTYVIVPHACDLNPGPGAFSIVAWVLTAAPGIQPIATKLDAMGGYDLSVVDGRVRLMVCSQGGCATAESTIVVNDGQWHLVGATLSRSAAPGATLVVYLDGAGAGSSIEPGIGPVDPASDLLLGACCIAGAPAEFFSGVLDEIEFFTRALRPEEIQGAYQADAAGHCRDPLAPLCDQCQELMVQAGVRDDFAQPEEPASPGPRMAQLCSNSVGFDAVPDGRPFCHTFDDLPATLAGAVLRIRMRAGPAMESCDDTIGLQAAGTGLRWVARLGSEDCSGRGAPGLLGCLWSPGTTHTFSLDLSSLPNADGSTTDLIPVVATQGGLDIFVEDHTSVDVADIIYLVRPSCPFPPDMVAWWPLDEEAGSVAADIARGHDGTLLYDTMHVPGKVGNALRFDGVSDRVLVGTDPDLNFGASSMSLDAWMFYDPDVSRGGGRALLRKTGAYRWMTGGPGRTHIHLGPSDTAIGLGLPPDCSLERQWVHMAVTVDTAARRIKFYLNGALCKAYLYPPPFMTSAEPLTISSRCDSFGGMLDEMEIWGRALDESEIAEIYLGGVKGKCKHDCYVPWDNVFADGATSILISADVCNFSTTDHLYQIGFRGVASCGAPAPGGFTMLSGSSTVLVAARSCTSFLVRIDRPAGLVFPAERCYEMRVMDLASRQVATCMGTLSAACPWVAEMPSSGFGSDGMRVPLPPTMVTNTREAGVLRYRFIVNGPDMHPDTQAVSLNDLPPGVPVTGSRVLDAGETVVLDLAAAFVRPQPLRWFTIVLEADLDGDGLYETALGSTGLRNQAAPTCPATITRQPQRFPALVHEAAVFHIGVAASQQPAFQWRRNGVPLADDGRYSGTHTGALLLSSAELSDAGVFDVVVTDPCGETVSAAAELVVYCPADYNRDGATNGQDFFDFLSDFLRAEFIADFNHNDILNSQDFFDFLTVFFTGC